MNNKTQQPNTIYLKDYQPPSYLVETVDLTFELHETKTKVTSVLNIKRNPDNTAKDNGLILDGQMMELVSVKLNQKSLHENDYLLDEEKLTLLNVPASFMLEITTVINPEQNKALEGLYLSSNMFCTQCEAEGFRRITYFPDRPDVMSRYSVKIIADQKQYPVLLSNGNLIDTGMTKEGMHWAKWHDPSLKPSYLFALVAGDLFVKEDTFTTMSGREVSLQVFVEHENSHKCDHALKSLKQAMKWDEETYGREYDLDIYMIVAVNDFNMGAMENKGLNVFNASCVLASPDTATDADYYNIQSIIAHEYFHNWSGNRVTCRDWFQLSLKEGFTVFRDQEFSADLNSRAVKRIDDVNILRTHQFAQDAGPMAHPVRPDHYIEISNFYTVTVYNKGAEVVRMIRNLVGGEGFRKGTDLYFSRFDGQAVTTDDFVAVMEEANTVDLSQFKNWYSQAGTPELEVTGTHNASDCTFELEISQSCPDTPGQKNKMPFYIPLELGLLDENGNELPLQLQNDTETVAASRSLHVKEKQQNYVFTGVKHRPHISLNRGFTSPVKVNINYSDEELAFLFANDSDEFNRWDAGQQLAINTLMELIRASQNNEPLVLSDTYINAFRDTLNNTGLDKSLLAQALTLPSEAYLAEQCDVVDVDAIYVARKFMRTELAALLKDEFFMRFNQCQSNSAYIFEANEIARRDLSRVCLSYLMTTKDPDIIELCMSQFESANNMTDVLSALGALSHYLVPQRQIALDLFYDKWKHDNQVVEKWLAIQAGSDIPDILNRVIQLQSHQSFSMTNPNKVRSLIGRFCGLNLVHFHSSDGAGYAFLADNIIKLDSMNPQIAARLVQNFSRWRRYDDKRQSLMLAQLNNILSKNDLSRDTFEIAQRSLEG